MTDHEALAALADPACLSRNETLVWLQERWFPRLTAYACSRGLIPDASDLCNTWLDRVNTTAGQFDAGKGSADNWLWRKFMWLCKDQCRANRSGSSSATLSPDLAIEGAEFGPSEGLEREEAVRAARECLAALSENERVLFLAYVGRNGVNRRGERWYTPMVTELKQMTALNPESFDTYVGRAKRKLSECIKKKTRA